MLCHVDKFPGDIKCLPKIRMSWTQESLGEIYVFETRSKYWDERKFWNSHHLSIKMIQEMVATDKEMVKQILCDRLNTKKFYWKEKKENHKTTEKS